MRYLIIFNLILSQVTAKVFDVSENKRGYRIHNGLQATRNQFPYQVSLIFTFSYLVFFEQSGQCSGSIISWNWILTAAHCAQG